VSTGTGKQERQKDVHCPARVSGRDARSPDHLIPRSKKRGRSFMASGSPFLRNCIGWALPTIPKFVERGCPILAVRSTGGGWTGRMTVPEILSVPHPSQGTKDGAPIHESLASTAVRSFRHTEFYRCELTPYEERCHALTSVSGHFGVTRTSRFHTIYACRPLAASVEYLIYIYRVRWM
jgi:hypothetical protein